MPRGNPKPSDPEITYPQECNVHLQGTERFYKDPNAELLFNEANGKQLIKIHAKLVRAANKQAEKLEEFYSTPYTENNARVFEATVNGLEVVQRIMDRWHVLLYPNQRNEAQT